MIFSKDYVGYLARQTVKHLIAEKMIATSSAAVVNERVTAAMVDELGSEGVGASGLSDVGAVVGATEPIHLERARELMPRAPLLLPGVGAQGGRAEELGPAFGPGRAAALVAASRAIVDAALEAGDAKAAREPAERLREGAWKHAA